MIVLNTDFFHSDNFFPITNFMDKKISQKNLVLQHKSSQIFVFTKYWSLKMSLIKQNVVQHISYITKKYHHKNVSLQLFVHQKISLSDHWLIMSILSILSFRSLQSLLVSNITLVL